MNNAWSRANITKVSAKDLLHTAGDWALEVYVLTMSFKSCQRSLLYKVAFIYLQCPIDAQYA